MVDAEEGVNSGLIAVVKAVVEADNGQEAREGRKGCWLWWLQ